MVAVANIDHLDIGTMPREGLPGVLGIRAWHISIAAGCVKSHGHVGAPGAGGVRHRERLTQSSFRMFHTVGEPRSEQLIRSRNRDALEHPVGSVVPVDQYLDDRCVRVKKCLLRCPEEPMVPIPGNDQAGEILTSRCDVATQARLERACENVWSADLRERTGPERAVHRRPTCLTECHDGRATL